MIRQCVILAGGQGTRLAPVWDGPKTLVPVGGKPFALYQLEWLARGGVWEVIYCVGADGARIRETLGDARFGMRLSYREDIPKAGTAGALRGVSGAITGRGAFVMYGDALPSPSFDRTGIAATEFDAQKIAMMIVRNDEVLQPSNCLLIENRVHRYGTVEKAYHLDAGLSVFPRAILAELPHQGELKDVLCGLAMGGRILAHQITSRPHHVGDPQALRELESSLVLR